MLRFVCLFILPQELQIIFQAPDQTHFFVFYCYVYARNPENNINMPLQRAKFQMTISKLAPLKTQKRNRVMLADIMAS